METLLAVKDLSVKSDNGRFGVFMAERKIDSFDQYKDASRLFSDLAISRKAAMGDELIGTVKYYPTAFGNGSLGVVVAKIKDGYVMQPLGSSAKARFEVSEDVLSEPPTSIQ